MQPCEVCGGMGIDALGYCTNCRNFRGVPGQASGMPYGGGPVSGGQVSGGPYGAPQTSGAPYGGYPTSPSPVYQTPTSAPPGAYPGYSQPAHAQPAYGQPAHGQPAYGVPATKSRSSFTVPLIALSATLVVLVVAIVIVVIVRGGGDETPSGPGTAAGPGASKSLVDECVVGTWDVTTYTEDVATEFGKLKFVNSGKGAVVRFGKDGKGEQDYGSGTRFTTNATIQGQNVRLELQITGKVTYEYRTNDGGMTYSNVNSDGKFTLSAPALNVSETNDFEGSSDPSKYTCNGGTMTLSTSLYRADLAKRS